MKDGEWWGVVWMIVKRGVEGGVAGWQESPTNRDLRVEKSWL